MSDFLIRVTPEALSSAAAEVMKKTKEIQGIFSEMRTQIQQTSACWTGEAADLYRALFEDQIPAMEKVVASFSEQASKLGQIAGNYSATSQAVAAVVEELPSDVIE